MLVKYQYKYSFIKQFDNDVNKISKLFPLNMNMKYILLHRIIYIKYDIID